ncbi:hypothetical protein PCE1_004430 [Barthelona sp. PCE]
MNVGNLVFDSSDDDDDFIPPSFVSKPIEKRQFVPLNTAYLQKMPNTGICAGPKLTKTINKAVRSLLASRELRLLIVYGVPGTGKTTAITNVLADHNHQASFLPPFNSGRKLINAICSVSDSRPPLFATYSLHSRSIVPSIPVIDPVPIKDTFFIDQISHIVNTLLKTTKLVMIHDGSEYELLKAFEAGGVDLYEVCDQGFAEIIEWKQPGKRALASAIRTHYPGVERAVVKGIVDSAVESDIFSITHCLQETRFALQRAMPPILSFNRVLIRFLHNRRVAYVDKAPTELHRKLRHGGGQLRSSLQGSIPSVADSRSFLSVFHASYTEFLENSDEQQKRLVELTEILADVDVLKTQFPSALGQADVYMLAITAFSCYDTFTGPTKGRRSIRRAFHNQFKDIGNRARSYRKAFDRAYPASSLQTFREKKSVKRIVERRRNIH